MRHPGCTEFQICTRPLKHAQQSAHKEQASQSKSTILGFGRHWLLWSWLACLAWLSWLLWFWWLGRLRRLPWSFSRLGRSRRCGSHRTRVVKRALVSHVTLAWVCGTICGYAAFPTVLPRCTVWSCGRALHQELIQRPRESRANHASTTNTQSNR